jgi:6-phosphogluconolactonase
MKKEKYVAYVSTYTGENDWGIRIYDADVKEGRLSEREHVSITNSSYLTISHNGRFIYSITDMGVEAFRIVKAGKLEHVNKASINGMRGCYVSTDYTDSYLFVAGYHDGKITVLKINEDGSVGTITDEVFHKGIGSIAERNFRPHVSCVKMTRDNHYLCACDLGLDHVKVYRFDLSTGKLKLADIVRCDQESAPRYIKFRKDGKFCYIIHELNNTIDVYSYAEEKDNPVFNKLQTVKTINDYHAGDSAACAMKFSQDYKYIFCSNAGDNSVGAFKIDEKTGLLEKKFVLPISGDYPKDIAVFPDNKHLVSLNHETDTMTFLLRIMTHSLFSKVTEI